jgi:GGDEF domain-containing protein
LSLREYDPSKPIDFSAGVAVVDKIDESALGLFQRANRALRAAKEAGGGLTVLEEAGKAEPETQEA